MKDIQSVLHDIAASVSRIEGYALRTATAAEGRTSVEREEDEPAVTSPLAFLLLEVLLYEGPMTVTELREMFIESIEGTDLLDEETANDYAELSVTQIYAILSVLQLAVPRMLRKKKNEWEVVINTNVSDLGEEYEEIIYPEILKMFKP